jgi:hypothetical protein
MTMYCQNCGKPVDRWNYCGSCEDYVDVSASPTSVEARQPRRQARPGVSPGRVSHPDHIGSPILFLLSNYSSLGFLIMWIYDMYQMDEASGAGVTKEEIFMDMVSDSMFMPMVVASLVSVVAGLLLLYQLWRFVINESSRKGFTARIDSPGIVIAFLLIPVFNVYWMFRVIGGLPRAFNDLAAAYRRSERMSTGLGVAVPLLVLGAFAPCFGTVFWVINACVITPMYFLQAVRNCKALQQGVTEEVNWQIEAPPSGRPVAPTQPAPPLRPPWEPPPFRQPSQPNQPGELPPAIPPKDWKR